jgi:hypothetical protein
VLNKKRDESLLSESAESTPLEDINEVTEESEINDCYSKARSQVRKKEATRHIK